MFDGLLVSWLVMSNRDWLKINKQYFFAFIRIVYIFVVSKKWNDMFLLIGKERDIFGNAGSMVMVESVPGDLEDFSRLYHIVDMENRVFYKDGEWVDLQVMKIGK